MEYNYEILMNEKVSGELKYFSFPHLEYKEKTDLILVLILITGSIAGVQTGQKFGQKVQGSELKTLLALLMLSVGVLMAYDTFFRNGTGTPAIQFPTDKIVEISEFGNTIYTISEKYPIVYGASSIFLALVAGVAASFLRKKVRQWIDGRAKKPAMY